MTTEDKKDKDYSDITIPTVEDQDGNYYVSISAVQTLAAELAGSFMEEHLGLMQSLSEHLDGADPDDPVKQLIALAGAAIGHGATMPIMLAVMADPDGKRFDGMSYADIRDILVNGEGEGADERSYH